MNLDQIMSELAALGSDQTKKVLIRHGAHEPFFGVKVADLKKLIARLKKTGIGAAEGTSMTGKTLHELALDLYATGNSDAMYMAALMVDPTKMTKAQLNDWVVKAYWYLLSDYSVAWTASESAFGWELALHWIRSDQEFIQSSGWATLSSIVAIRSDSDLDKSTLEMLLHEVGDTLQFAQNRVRYAMNNFVIAVGSYVPALTEKAKTIGKTLGKVQVDMGGTSCKVPNAPEYIQKVESLGRLGKKRKSAVC